MAKVNIKFGKITLFGGFFHVRDTKAFGLKRSSRIKAFVFKFISVPAKWIRTARHYVLNIYTDNQSYLNPFALADG